MKNNLIIVAFDVHGNERMIDKVEDFKRQYPTAMTLFGGDYVDGHREGCLILKRINAMQQKEPNKIIILRGNHEQMLLDFMTNFNDQLWLGNGGHQTLRFWCKVLHLPAGSNYMMRKQILASEPDLLKWLNSLLYTFRFHQLFFVHAGVDWTKNHPLTETSIPNMMWLREEYLYIDPEVPVFAHNPTDKTLITGHTPTAFIYGRYAKHVRPPYANEFADRRFPCPIKVIQYPNEKARYFMDGGNHAGDSRIGNIAVFNADNGKIVDQYED